MSEVRCKPISISIGGKELDCTGDDDIYLNGKPNCETQNGAGEVMLARCHKCGWQNMRQRANGIICNRRDAVLCRVVLDGEG